MEEDDYFDEEYWENQPHESCPMCGRSYDDIDFDYQICSKCGWDVERKRYDNSCIREPEDDDYMNGDADCLTGRWY